MSSSATATRGSPSCSTRSFAADPALTLRSREGADAELFVGTIPPDGLDWLLILSRVHLEHVITEIVTDYDERALAGALPPLADTRQVARNVYDAVVGYGPLQPYLDDPQIEEVWLNEPVGCQKSDGAVT